MREEEIKMPLLEEEVKVSLRKSSEIEFKQLESE